jgi:hypothetical protein
LRQPHSGGDVDSHFDFKDVDTMLYVESWLDLINMLTDFLLFSIRPGWTGAEQKLSSFPPFQLDAVSFASGFQSSTVSTVRLFLVAFAF